MSTKEVTSLPVYLSFAGPDKRVLGRGEAGWTVVEFSNPVEAAAFFQANKFCAMPCWKRMDVVEGKLMVVR